jgi:hypothetical protein
MDENKPVSLVQDAQTGARFLIYSTSQGVDIDLQFEGDQLWMTQAQIADLYGRDVSVVSRHITAIIEEGELDESNLQKMQIAFSDRPVTLYNLDMVISVGYRVSSKQATLFRRWATDKLVQFATKGFVVDAQRLKGAGARDRIAELREIIRDIRADEANVYRELQQICKMCQDYDPASPDWQAFFKNTQAKLIYAVTGETPSEIIYNRVNAALPDMGLTTWRNENIRKSDVGVSKNYLQATEVKELNRLTTILLDIMEDQMDIGRLKLMSEAEDLLEDQLKRLNRTVLSDGGKISSQQAQDRAESNYVSYKARMKTLRQEQADRRIASINDIRKALPNAK